MRNLSNKTLAHLIWWRAWGGVGGLAVNTNYNKIARELVRNHYEMFHSPHSIARINGIIRETHKPNSHKMRSLAILNKLRPWLENLDFNLIARKQANARAPRPPPQLRARQQAITNTRRRLNAFKANLKMRPGETPTRQYKRINSMKFPFNRGANGYWEAWNAKKQALATARQPWRNNKGVTHI